MAPIGGLPIAQGREKIKKNRNRTLVMSLIKWREGSRGGDLPSKKQTQEDCRTLNGRVGWCRGEDLKGQSKRKRKHCLRSK